MTRPEIREAVAADACAISGILRRAFAEFQPRYTPEAFAATTPGPDLVLARMQEGPLWIATYEQQAIGTVGALRQPCGCYLRGMAVLREARAHGVGYQLLKTVEEFARQQGMPRLCLNTTPFLDSAIRLYERFGFRRGAESDLFGTPLFMMSKDLSPDAP